jgi:Zn-dependent protease with chaperone function
MNHLSRLALGVAAAGLLVIGTSSALAGPQQSGSAAGQDPNQSQGQQQSSGQQPAPPQPAPPAPTPAPAAKNGDVTDNGPVQQPDSVHPKNSKDDVDAIGNRKVGNGVNFYSLEHEIALGKGLAQEVERSSKLIDDPVVTEYVNRVGQNLVRNSDAKVPFTIKVIDSDVVNAFALPGGFFYVNSGLILRAQEESELAGVMAHEISHVCARHGTKNATKGEIMQLASIPAMIFIPYGMAGYGIYEGMNLAIPLTFLKFSRDSEKEADYLGLQYMYKAGYDPNSYVTFFERIEADEKRRPGTIPKVFSTHPPTPDRIENAQKEIAKILPNRPEYIVSTSEFDSVKARLRNIMFTKKVNDNQPGKPTLRTKTAQSKQPPNTSPTDPNTTGEDDDRPTLKRRDGDGQPQPTSQPNPNPNPNPTSQPTQQPTSQPNPNPNPNPASQPTQQPAPPPAPPNPQP